MRPKAKSKSRTRAPAGERLCSPEELHARKEQAVLEQYAKNVLRKEDNFTPFERAVLVKHGIIESDTTPVAESGGEPIRNHNTQQALAIMLARHFSGRFKGDLNEQLISAWKAGLRMPKGAPLPPSKEGNFHIGQKWVQWVEDFILTDSRFAAGGGTRAADAEIDVHEQALIAKAQSLILDRDTKAMDFELRQGRYVRREQAEVTRRGMLKLYHSFVRRKMENTNTKHRAEWLEKYLTPEVFLAFKEFDAALERSTVDAIESEVQKHASAEPEKEQAKQLAEEMVRV